MEVQIEYKGITLLVGGTYTESESKTHDYPGSSSNFDINEVFVGKIDIYELFSWDELSKITEEVLNKIEE